MMIIYQAKCLSNGKRYVGKTKTTLEKRRYTHEYNALVKNHRSYFYNALRKHGKDNFEWSILYVARIDESLEELEQQFIKSLNTLSPDGYNLTKGGEGGDTFSYLSPEQQEHKKQKLREYMKTRGDVLTPESRERIRKHMINNNPMKTENGVNAMLASRVYTKGPSHPSYGRHLSEEQKKKLSEARAGKKASEETKALKKAQTQGANNPNASPVQCVETGEVFACIKDAQQKFGKILAISLACRKGCLAGGFHWNYIKDPQQ